MKKIFTIDDIMIAFISALGSGYGETLSRLFGWPNILCGAASLVLGLVLGEIIRKITFSEAIQRKPINRFITYAACFLIFIIGHAASMKWMGASMITYLMSEMAFTVGMPILGFVISLIIRAYRVRKIRETYGSGSDGYVFYIKKEDVDEANEENKPVLSEYDTDFAVRTRTGVYVGEKDGSTVSYLGIPYAKPPVGELRWKAPEPLLSSSAVYEAKNFGASAIQVEQKGSILKLHRQSEDCLTLNIWVSDEESDAKKPVMVLFHNGDFSFGGSADPLMSGEEFADAHPGIVVVSINYRLGIFGFIDFSDVPGGKDYSDALNLGLLDQIAALKWIRENISAFGGDPDRITLLGFDSGASSILLLSVSEEAKGLFQKAFAFNGRPEAAYTSPEASRALAGDLLKETDTHNMDELAALSSESLKDAAQKLWGSMCAPTCDGSLIPGDVYRAYKDGAASGIEFIIGIPKNETSVFRSYVGDQKYERGLSSALEDMKMSPEDSAALTDTKTKSKLVDKWNALSIYQCAEIIHEGGSKVHLLGWAEKPLLRHLGSGTVDAAASLLGNTEALEMYGNVLNEDLSEILQMFLQKFVCGESLELYPNEIKGVDGIKWKGFPKGIVVEGGRTILLS